MTRAIDKREAALEAKYGGKAKLKAKRRLWQAKSRLKYKGTGGFNHMKRTDPQRLRQITSQGGKASAKAKSQTAVEKQDNA